MDIVIMGHAVRRAIVGDAVFNVQEHIIRGGYRDDIPALIRMKTVVRGPGQVGIRQLAPLDMGSGERFPDGRVGHQDIGARLFDFRSGQMLLLNRIIVEIETDFVEVLYPLPFTIGRIQDRLQTLGQRPIRYPCCRDAF